MNKQIKFSKRLQLQAKKNFQMHLQFELFEWFVQNFGFYKFHLYLEPELKFPSCSPFYNYFTFLTVITAKTKPISFVSQPLNEHFRQ